MGKRIGLILAFLVLIGIVKFIPLVGAEGLTKTDPGLQRNINLDLIIDQDGQELFSLRQLAKEFNWELSYLPAVKVIFISNGSHQVSLAIGQDEFAGHKLTKSPVIINEKTYLDLELVKLIMDKLVLGGRPRFLTSLVTDKKEYKSGEEVFAHIRVYNLTQNAIELNFRSSQIYDLYLLKNGQEIWRWSRGKFFTMALVQKVLKPGDKLDYKVKIPLNKKIKQGKYILTGEISADNKIKLTEFEIEIKS